MKYLGINYDTGIRTLTGTLTRETFDPGIVAAEIGIIKSELHCNAIRISGEEIERIASASEIALEMGLTVFFAASLQYKNQATTLEYIIKAAEAAEKLRAKYQQVIFVTGCELSVFTSGFIKGDTGEERIANMFSPFSLLKNMIGISRRYNQRLNYFLATATAIIRNQFHGQITYASGTWEKVDWKLFDIIGIDYYRSSFNYKTYIKELQRYKTLGKPVSIMEFGCCAYKGAADKGAMGWAIVDWKSSRPKLKGDYIRDEDEQSGYLLELLGIFESEDVSACFVFTFATYNYVYDEDPAFDLDMASYGIVKVTGNREAGYKNLPWFPKKAFFDVGGYYAAKHNNIKE
jgi:hypothetical protein